MFIFQAHANLFELLQDMLDALIDRHAMSDQAVQGLGDRVVLFTARPGRIKEIVPVRLARPRSITGKEEVQLLEYLSEQIRDEVERALKAEGLT